MDPSRKMLQISILSSCENCLIPSGKPISLTERHRYYLWACQLQCPSCDSSWYICSLCPSSRKWLKTNQQLSDHNYKYHKLSKQQATSLATCNETYSPVAGICSNSIDSAYEIDRYAGDDVELSAQGQSSAIALPGPPIMNFVGVHNRDYFSNQLNELGAAYIVSYSQFKLPNVATEMDDSEVKFHLAVASLLTQITSGQHKKLADIIKLAAVVMERQLMDERRSSLWHTQLPQTSSLMRSLYMEGKYAMLPNLPRPSVRTCY
jgi:hypothetical protein